MSLGYCFKCNEDSIATKIKVRASDGMRTKFEYCINKNPDCQYKKYTELGYENKKKEKETVLHKKEKSGQLELW